MHTNHTFMKQFKKDCQLQVAFLFLDVDFWMLLPKNPRFLAPVPGGYQCKVEISSPVAKRNANLGQRTWRNGRETILQFIQGP